VTRNESRSRLLIAGALGLANIALVASLALAGLGVPASAQVPNRISTSSAA
jgi:hypothetical protein